MLAGPEADQQEVALTSSWLEFFWEKSNKETTTTTTKNPEVVMYTEKQLWTLPLTLFPGAER